MCEGSEDGKSRVSLGYRSSRAFTSSHGLVEGSESVTLRIRRLRNHQLGADDPPGGISKTWLVPHQSVRGAYRKHLDSRMTLLDILTTDLTDSKAESSPHRAPDSRTQLSSLSSLSSRVNADDVGTRERLIEGHG